MAISKEAKRLYDIQYRIRNWDAIKRKKRKYYAANKLAKKDYDKKYRQGRRLVDKNKELLRNYGIGLKEYTDMLISQDYKCKICQLNEHESSQMLSVDHCHSTGKVRALLCVSCNMALGGLKDSVVLLNRCIIYLETQGEKTCL